MVDRATLARTTALLRAPNCQRSPINGLGVLVRLLAPGLWLWRRAGGWECSFGRGIA
jgi:hypothetical protein